MGQSLSEPVTVKTTERCHNELFSVGCSSMQGWRPHMEDASSIQVPLDDDPNSAYFAVFDGHGCQHFATYCSEELHKQLVTDNNYKEGNYEQALKTSFLSLDHTLQTDTSLNYQHEPGGTTAVVVLIKEGTIFCANAGDSRAIACVQGNIQELSHDHKPMHPSEENRIYKAGGWIECNRVNGSLALSRAIGDFNFKLNNDLPSEEQIVTANPEIIVYPMVEDHEFIVVACDGVWDVMSNMEVVEFVRRRIADNMSPDLICEALIDSCLAPDCRMGGLGCDNMTVILVCFLHSEPYSSLARRCSKTSTGIEIGGSQNRAHHSWAHKRNCVLVHKSDIDRQVEESLTFGSTPKSKLNDTVSGANTDLDSEIASSHEQSDDFTELFKGSKEVNEISHNGESSPDKPKSQTDDEDMDLWDETFPMNCEPSSAIETTV